MAGNFTRCRAAEDVLNRGYIKLWRAIQDSDVWFPNRHGKDKTASPAEAWIDLVMMAAYKPGNISVRGSRVRLQRGEVAAAVRFLAERWHWSNGKVIRFQNELKVRGDIGTRTERGLTVISITNYNKYNDTPNQNGTQNGTATEQPRNTDGTATEQIKEGKKLRREEGEGIASPVPTAEDFPDSPPPPLPDSSAGHMELTTLVKQFCKKAEWQGSQRPVYEHLKTLLGNGYDLSREIEARVLPGMKPWHFTDDVRGVDSRRDMQRNAVLERVRRA